MFVDVGTDYVDHVFLVDASRLQFIIVGCESSDSPSGVRKNFKI